MVNELDLELLGVGVHVGPLDGVAAGEVELCVLLGLGDLDGWKGCVN